MNQDHIDSLVRSLAKVAGGILTAHGAVAAATILNSSNILELISGIVMSVIAFYASHTTNASQPVNTTAIEVTPKVTTESIATATPVTPVVTPAIK